MDLEQRKAKAHELRIAGPRSPGREVRSCAVDGLEMREAGEGTFNISGYASVTESSYDMGFYEETIAAGAFGRTLAANPDVQLLINHEGLPLARTVGGSLRLAEDSRGLLFDADIAASDPDVQRLASKVERGLIDQCSFAFMGAKSEWDEDFTQRRIVDLSIHRGDVSIVNQGANPATSFQFNAADGLAWFEGLADDEARALFRARFPEPVEEPVTHDLDIYRARAFTLRARGKSTARR